MEALLDSGYEKGDYLRATSKKGNSEIFNKVAVFGFLLIVVGTCLPFVPVVKTSWVKMGIGLPVLFCALAGAFFVLARNHFAAFFACMFPAFFTVHGVIIAYDKIAIASDAVSGPHGYMRSIPLIFKNAMVPSSGAFWTLLGSIIALIAVFVGWGLKIFKQNQSLAETAEREYAQANSGEFQDESSNNNDSTKKMNTKHVIVAEKNEVSAEADNPN